MSILPKRSPNRPLDACNGCDVLIHEVNTLSALAARPAMFQAFAGMYHTSTTQLAELAAQAKPKLLVLYHASISLRPRVNAERVFPLGQLPIGGQVILLDCRSFATSPNRAHAWSQWQRGANSRIKVSITVSSAV